MSDLLVIAAFASFLLFFAAGRYRKVTAIAGWTCIVANLWSELSALFREDNFLYPAIALLSLPFLVITAERLVHDDPVILQLSRTAAIATVMYVPCALVPVLHDGLIAVTVTLVFYIITALGQHPQLVAWDVILENGFANQIILGCTGIMAIALMLGVVFGEKDLSLRQALLSVLLVVPPILLLNLLRVSVIFIAVSDHWFASFPDPTGTGDANFFWAHNVVAEGLSLIFLLALVLVLARVIPRLGMFTRALAGVYLGRLQAFVVQARDTFEY
jgi:archaeosortase A (PGF-CTERM-specific)